MAIPSLIGGNRIQLLGSNVVQKLFQRRPVHVVPGGAAVVVLLGNDMPAFVALAGKVGLTGFGLGLEGVEGFSSPPSDDLRV
jgi:hypothetical protein